MLKQYLSEIQKLYNPNAKEHAYRTPLQNLLTNYVGNNYQVHHENKSDDGVPDFTIRTKDNRLIGFIECKDIDVDLSSAIQNKKSAKNGYKQLKKYLTIAPILIYTDYIKFYLLSLIDNKIEILDKCVLLDDIQDKVNLNDELEAKFFALLDTFLQSKPQAIKNQNAFISQIARQTKILNEQILNECKDSTSYFKQEIQELFNNTIFKDLDDSDFSGAFSQLITFSLLFYRLTERKSVTLDTFKKMPNYIPIFKELLNVFDPNRCHSIMLYTIESIVDSINAYDEEMFHKELSYKDSHDVQDPFIYMYENFLKEFDPDVRNARGVFYTPLEVVRYMIRSLDELLKDRLSLSNGLQNKDVHILDFATGTGTFLLGAIEYIYTNLAKSNNQGLWKGQVSEFILKQLYGFEFLVVPYVLAHFRIHEYLNACDYEYQKNERLRLYLTNTLDNSETSHVPMFPNLNHEADMAYKIKNESPILVIMGNPPYNSSTSPMNSKKWITDLVGTYQTGLSGTEKGKLTYDEIKFIRFAHWKLENVDKGIMTIIVNNNFINGISHKVMREELMKTFDEIYIYDLHGNINKGEVNPVNGSQDFNVFDIKNVGVCIATFVKTGIKDNPNKGVYYQEIYGTQKEKKAHLNELSWKQDTQDKKWIKLEENKKWHWFVPKTADTQYWEEFIGLQDIFEIVKSGIKFRKDNLLVRSHFTKESVQTMLDEMQSKSNDYILSKYNTTETDDWKLDNKKQYFIDKDYQNIQQVHYRPFDFMYTYYPPHINKIIVRGDDRYGTMKHLIDRDNMGLVFTRSFVEKTFQHVSVVNMLIDIHVNSGQDYIAPLYLYTESDTEGLGFSETKTPNFTKAFNEIIKNHPILSHKTPEQILAYIYAILYAPSYRSKYAEDLSYDYPRVPFITDKDKFDELERLGQELINLHLMKMIPDHDIGYPIDGDNIVDNPRYLDNKLYINGTQYLTNIDEKTYNYTIGGYQVIEKWLKSRKETTLSLDDIRHLQNVCVILKHTIKLQDEIDSVWREINA
ncbi:MAG: type ISP restriction/modification enzyme [Brevinemataceae bacterium]